ncbi:diguanylate cyclase (plasmid) [Neorhizobium galegae]|nr:diguanylate cyclase [Neorhizobium galegae]
MLTPFEVIFANIAQGIALLDSDLRVLVINNRLSQLLQIPELTMGVDAKVIADHLPACNQTRLWLTLGHRAENAAAGNRSRRGTAVLDFHSRGRGLLVDPVQGYISAGSDKKELSEQTNLFDTALANMPHGLCMFDADKNLMLCNTAYSRLYSLPEQLTRPGTPLQQILDYRVTAGNAPVDRETYFDVVVEAALKRSVASQNISLVDGRVIKISHNPMENGGYVAAHEDVTDAVRADEQIKYMAGHDPLTGLPNRTLLREKIDREVAVSGKTSSLLCLDLDRFKEVNDSLGHAVGDLLLKAVADRLTDCLRDGDSIARLGGDEFVIFQTDVQSRDQASSLAQRIIDVVDKAFIIDGKSVRIGVSIGIAMAPDDGDMGDSLLRHADTALYKAKANGRGTFCFFETVMDVDRQARRDLETVLQQALETNQFEALLSAAGGHDKRTGCWVRGPPALASP